MKINKGSIAVLIFSFIFLITTYGQLEEYQYRRKLEGISENWHSILLPSDIYKNITPGLQDLRIIGFTNSGDTIEAPYIERSLAMVQITEDVRFKIINQSKRNEDYYYTFEVPSAQAINQIKLQFSENNFDRYVTLEGSNNQNQWFEIIAGYRILSIDNEYIQYNYSTLNFTPVKYRYLRMHFESKQKPNLESVFLQDKLSDSGSYRSASPISVTTKNNSKAKTTTIDIQLDKKIPVWSIQLTVGDKIDYYRPITIEYLNDSIHTEKGWLHSYSQIFSGTLSSLETNEFWFNYFIVTNRLRITINNFDNQPLTIGNVGIKENITALITRITQKADYYLYYGNKNASSANYDIAIFSDKIPNNPTKLVLANEESLTKSTYKDKESGMDKRLLYSLMAVIILILGGFTIFMIRNLKKLKNE